MNTIRAIILIFSFWIISTHVWAVKVYECEDELGNRSFQANCPPGSTLVNEKNYSTGKGNNSDENKLMPLVLYMVPDCIVCNQVKDYIVEKKLALTEKNVEEDFELQQELKSKNNGQLRVPVLLVGDMAISGFNPDNIASALSDAGYISGETDK